MARKPARKAGGRKSSAKRKAPSRASGRGTPRRPATAGRGARRPSAARSARTSRARKAAGKAAKKQTVKAPRKTAAKGRSVKAPTTRTAPKRAAAPAAAQRVRQAPSLERERKRLRDVEDRLPSPPSSLDMDRRGSAARTGRATIRQARHEHTESSPALTGGDVDADWEDAYAVGDEAPGGDNPTPDQDRVDDIGKALGIEYQDNEELKASDKVASRDKHRWELDPASAEDYSDRD